MSLIFHNFKKDFHNLRFYLLTWFGLLLFGIIWIVSFITGFLGNKNSDDFIYSTYFLIFFFQLFALAFVIAHLVQADSPFRTTTFCLTRPISRFELLLSKTLFVFIFLLLVPFVIEIGTLLFLGIPLHTLSMTIPNIFLPQLLIIIPLLMIALLTSNVRKFFFSVFISILIFISVGIFLSKYALFSLPQYSSDNSIILAIFQVLVIFFLSIFTNFYLTRKYERSLAFILTEFLITVFLFIYFPFINIENNHSLSYEFDYSKTESNENSFNPNTVELSIDSSGTPWQNKELDNKALFRESLLAKSGAVLQINAADPSLLLVPNYIKSHGLSEKYLLNANLTKHAVDRNHFFKNINYEGSFLHPLGNPLIHFPHNFYREKWPILITDNNSSTGSSIFDVNFSIKKYVTVFLLPIIKNSKLQLKAAYIKIRDISLSPEGCHISLLSFTFYRRPYFVEHNAFILLNKKKNQAVFETNEQYPYFGHFQGSSFSIFKNLLFKINYLSFKGNSDISITQEWLSESELVYIELKNLGTFTKTLDLEKKTNISNQPKFFKQTKN